MFITISGVLLGAVAGMITRGLMSHQCRVLTGKELGRQYKIGLIGLGVICLAGSLLFFAFYSMMVKTSSTVPRWPFIVGAIAGPIILSPAVIVLLLNYLKRDRIFLIRNARRSAIEAVLQGALKPFGFQTVPAPRLVFAQRWEVTGARVLVRGTKIGNVTTLEVSGENREIAAELRSKLAQALARFAETAPLLSPLQFSLRTALLAILFCGSWGTLYWHWDPWVKELDFPGAEDVQCLDISPDGRRLVTGSQEGALIAWDIENGDKICDLAQYKRTIRRVEIDPTGQTAFVTCANGQVSLFHSINVKQGEVLTPKDGGVEFSPDGKLAAITTKFGGAVLLDVSKSSQVGEIKHGESFIRAIFSPDSRSLITAGDDNMIHVWRVGDHSRERDLEGKVEDTPELSRSPDGKLLLGVVPDGNAYVWNFATGQCLYTFKQPGIEQAIFSPDNDYILALSRGVWPVWVWDAKTGNCLRTLTGIGDSPFCISCSPDAHQILVGSRDYVELWDAGSFAKAGAIRQIGIQTAAFCPNSREIVVGGYHLVKWSRRRADGPLGVFVLPELWTTLLLGIGIYMSFLRDQRGRE